MKAERSCRALDLPVHLHADGEANCSCTESPGSDAQGPCKVSRITDEGKRNRTGAHPHISGEVNPASPCWESSRWDVMAAPPLICTQSSGFDAVITEVSKCSLEKWNQGKKRSSSSKESRWDVGREACITEVSKFPLEKWNQGNKRSSSSSKVSRWDVGRESANKTSSTDEVEIAQFLPLCEDLLVKILALLPLPKLLQLRLVCRWWDKRLLRTPHLWKSWASRQCCWFVMVRKRKWLFAKEFIAYCLTNTPQLGGRKTGHWLSLSPLLEAPQIAAHVGGKEARRVVCRPPVFDGHLFSLSSCLVAGGQGHICFMYECLKQDLPALEIPETYKYHSMVFERCNPTPLVVDILTGATEILPPPQSPGFSKSCAYLNMTFLPRTSNAGYYIVLSSRTNVTFLEVFSSDTGSWRTVLDPYAPCSHVPATSEVQSGDIFWLSHDGYPLSIKAYHCRQGPLPNIDGIRGYNVQADAWSEVSVDFPSDAHGVFSLITKHKGCLVLADLVDSPNSRCQYEKLGAVGIWVLQQSSSLSPGTARWVQIARTPPEYWEGLCNSTSIYGADTLFVKFFSFGGLICMTGVVLGFASDDEGYDYLAPYVYLTPLVYDLDLDSWYHLPAYKGGIGVMGLFALHPASPFRD